MEIPSGNTPKELLAKGKELLLSGDLLALDYFEEIHKNTQDFSTLFEVANLLLKEGKNQKKIYLAAKKILKSALKLKPSDTRALHLLGQILLKIEDPPNQIREILQKAIDGKENLEKEELAALYWDHALALSRLSESSGEACDVRKAIQSMRLSFAHQKNISSVFWHDFGYIHLQMALFVNDNRIYLQAVDYLKRAIKIDNSYFNAFLALAQANTELYINTMNENYFKEADLAFSRSSELAPDEAELWLSWSQLLLEAGKQQKDQKKLSSALEKCTSAERLSSSNPYIIGQKGEILSTLGLLTNRLELLSSAEELLLNALVRNPVAELFYSLGVCLTAYGEYFQDRQYDEWAIERFQEGLSADRSIAELWQELAAAHARIGEEIEDLSCLERSVKFYQKAIELKPSCSSLLFDYAKTLLKIGELTLSKDALKESAHQFESTLTAQKDALLQHPSWLYCYGKCLKRLATVTDLDPEALLLKALQLFHQVLLIDPDYNSLSLEIALTYADLANLTLEKSSFEKALSFFAAAEKITPEDDALYLEWGITLIAFAEEQYASAKKPLYDEAEKKLLFSGRLGNQESTYHLATLYSLREDPEKALSFLEKGKEYDILPPIEDLLEDEWLENVKKAPAFAKFLTELETKQNLRDEG